MHTIMCPRPKAHECGLQWWQSLTSARCQEVGLLFVYVALHSPHFVVANTQTMRLVCTLLCIFVFNCQLLCETFLTLCLISSTTITLSGFTTFYSLVSVYLCVVSIDNCHSILCVAPMVLDIGSIDFSSTPPPKTYE